MKPLVMTPDVNILVACARSDHVHHMVARAWLDGARSCCARGGTVKLMPMVVASFLRLVTNPRIFETPMPVESAVAFADALLAVPGVDMVSLGAEWPVLRQLCLGLQLTGNALPDAWLAAAVQYGGGHLVTFDKDFKKLLGRAQLTVLETG